MSRIRKEDLPKGIINPAEVPVYGWERKKDPRVIWAIVQAVRSGKALPRVIVNPRADGGYNLDNEWTDPSKGMLTIDGGHNRALAHLIADEPMRVYVDVKKEVRNLFRPRMPLTTIRFKPDSFVFKQYRRRFPDADFSVPQIDYMNERINEVRDALYSHIPDISSTESPTLTGEE